MNDQLPQFDELRQLLIGLIDEEADRDFAAKRHRLMELLRDDPQARRFYLEYIMTDAMLRLELSAPLAGAGMESEFDLAARRHFGNQEVDAAVLLGEPALDAPPAPPRIIIDPTATGRYRDAGSPFVGGFVFSYMVASIFMCLLLLGFWAYKLPSDRGSSIASSDNSRRSTTSG
ncbi:MAG: hypothetical protein GX594_17810, partial [Pirellulaceae bacterium]|nr:hypothetical protein [Pirellulaceae bacterium]